MRRVVLESAELSGDALDELKQWLGISRSNEDANLIVLLQASLDICEGFLGKRPLAAQCEEVTDRQSGWIALSTQPVGIVLGIDAMDKNNARTAIAESDFETKIDAAGKAKFRIKSASNMNIDTPRFVARFAAGIAEDWNALPGALRHGVIRLAAFHYRERDSAKAMSPPASVTALWRPWRRMKLA